MMTTEPVWSLTKDHLLIHLCIVIICMMFNSIFLITVFPKRTPAFATGSAAAVTAAPPVARHARRSGSRARLPVIQRAPVRRRALPAHKTAFVVAGFLPSCARTTSKHTGASEARALAAKSPFPAGEELCPATSDDKDFDSNSRLSTAATMSMAHQDGAQSSQMGTQVGNMAFC